MHSKIDEKSARAMRKWRNILIDPGYQSRYLFWLSFTSLSLIFLYGGLTYHYISENYSILVDLSPMTDEAKIQLYKELREIIFKISGISFIFLIVTTFLGLIQSHRTAGALFHFRKVFEAIRDGNRERRIRLRPKDEFQAAAKSFNEMMDVLTGSDSKK
ncbi:MAG: methyl-accepting chemotaxis protein [Bdellovibrionia bacterium]